MKSPSKGDEERTEEEVAEDKEEQERERPWRTNMKLKLATDEGNLNRTVFVCSVSCDKNVCD